MKTVKQEELAAIGENWYQRTRRLAEAQLDQSKPPEYRMKAFYLSMVMHARITKVAVELTNMNRVDMSNFKEGGYVHKVQFSQHENGEWKGRQL